MSYKALYRKYRPTDFDTVAGQKHIIKTLNNAVKQDKIAHAYLFCGPRGTGKTSTAKIFARAINCENEFKPCNECENCKLALENNHPDIIEIDAASNNGVEEVRNLIEKVKYAPLKGKYKIYIIDEVHMMSKSAYNALLKTIEEPPKHVIFIFATTEPNKVLPTIISRCQRYDFTRIAKVDIVDALAKVCDKENINYEHGVLENIADICDGGMRDALSILDQCYAYSPDQIKVEDVFEIYGIVRMDEKMSLLASVKENDTQTMVKMMNVFVKKAIDIKKLTSDLINILKEKVVIDYTNDFELVDIINEEEYNEMASKFDTNQVLKMIDILMETYEKFQFATNTGSYLEIAFLKMMNVSRETLSENIMVNNNNNNNNNNNLENIESKKNIEINKSNVEEKNENNKKINTSNKITQEKVIIKETYKEIKPLSDEFVLSLLSGANKQEKIENQEKYKKLNDYVYDINYAKYANMLKNSIIAASGENYIVVATDNQTIANEINNIDQKGEFIDFMNKILDKPKKVFAISKSHFENITKIFIDKLKSNTLPKPLEIKLDTVNNQQVDEIESDLINLFGDNIKIEED